MKLFAHLTKRIEDTSSLYLGTLLFIITFILYATTLTNGLFFDDEHFIYNNPFVTSFSIGDIFTNSLLTGTGELSNYYRPLLFTTFSIEYQLFKDNAFIYHFTNMLLHSAVGILLYVLLTKLFKNKSISFLTSILFLIHPVQTEAVAYANSRGDSLSLLFVLVTLLMSLSSKSKWHLISFVTFLCGLLSKELALVTPFLVLLVHSVEKNPFTTARIKNAFWKALPYFIIAIVYFLLRLTVLNFDNTLNFSEIENVYTSNIFVRLNTFFSLIPLYISLLVAPIHLFMERDETITIAQSFSYLTILIPLIFITLLTIGWKIKKPYPEVLFGVLWFIVCFGPTSGIIPINGIFYEHFLYYPSIGYFLIVSTLLIYILKKIAPALSSFIIILMFIYVLLLSYRTILRNIEWNNPITFYTQTLTYAQTARIYNNLAMSYANSGNNKKAIENYKKSLEISNTYPETYYNLGNAYVAVKDYDQAEKNYLISLSLHPGFSSPYINLGNLYIETQQKEKLIKLLDQMEQISKKYPNLSPTLLLLKENSDML